MTELEHETWRKLYKSRNLLRSQQMVPLFTEGLRVLGISDERIPDLSEVNRKLENLTGWQGVFVEGFKSPDLFFEMLACRQFPVGNFIRSAEDLAYTPAPDIFHDLYGHIPFYADRNYADFSYEFGRRALKFVSAPEKIEAFQRLFWFALEFGLLKTPQGLRIFGAGIASSFQECAYALSDRPERVAFDLHKIKNQDFRIDQLQTRLFVLDSVEQLYGCLDAFEAELNL